MDIKDVLSTLAPTVASALLGPLGGVAVSAIGSILGIDAPTQDKITKAIQGGQMTADQLTQIKALELQYQNEEKERNFKYADLEFRDRQSARSSNVAGGIQDKLFSLSILILVITLGTEMVVLFSGYPGGLSEIIVGRVLGLMDSIAMLVLAYWYGTSSSSHQKNELLAQSSPVK